MYWEGVKELEPIEKKNQVFIQTFDLFDSYFICFSSTKDKTLF